MVTKIFKDKRLIITPIDNKDLKCAKLEVFENNAPAIALYRKMGFEIVAKIPKQVQYKGKLIGEYIMIKKSSKQ